MKLTFKTIFISLSVLSILTCLIDYFITSDFHFESGVILLILIILVLNILRLIYPKLNDLALELIFNFRFFGFTIFNFLYLSLLSWGYMFTTGRISNILWLAILLNFIYFTTLLIWFGKQLKSLQN